MSHDGVVEQPPVTDYGAIIDVVRRRGSVHYVKDVVPGEFNAWRRRVRQAARVGDLRISVTRSRDYVIVENLDYEVSDEDSLATSDVIGALLDGQDLLFEEAVRARRRQRLRVVRPDERPTDGE